MVIACCREPMVGWTDTLSAAGAVGFPMALGLTRKVFITSKNLDLIPADIVSNSILASVVWAAKTPTPEFTVFHNSSSVANPMSGYGFWKAGSEYLATSPFQRAVDAPGF